MSAIGVRREKAALSSGCEFHPATAPAGSNRSSYGGNEVLENAARATVISLRQTASSLARSALTIGDGN